MLVLDTIKVAIKHTLERTDATEDELLRLWEAAAIAHVQRVTGRYFGDVIEDEEQVVIGDGSSQLYLPNYVSEVTALSEVGWVRSATPTVIEFDAVDGWALRAPFGATHGNVLVRKSGYAWTRNYEYTVTGTVGFAGNAAPADVQQAVLLLVNHWYVNRIPVALGTVAPEIALTVRDLLRPHIRHTV